MECRQNSRRPPPVKPEFDRGAAATESSPARPVQLELAIDAAPRKVRDHGYREAHSRPLVSRGKRPDGSHGPAWRTTPADAWAWPSLELRSGGAWPAIILDCDGRAGTEALAEALLARAIPDPNWMVTRATSGGSHVVYCLRRPVLRGAAARPRPLAMLGRVAEYLADVAGADPSYVGVLSHNPMRAGQRGTALKTTWGRRSPYSLSELGSYVPSGWRKPSVPATAIGRNCALFEALMRFAGSPRNAGVALSPAAERANAQFTVPLDAREVAGIVKSVERYRARWGWYTDAERSAHGRRRGIASGAARRAGTADRDREIARLRGEGWTLQAIGDRVGLHRASVLRVLARLEPLPLLDGGGE